MNDIEEVPGYDIFIVLLSNYLGIMSNTKETYKVNKEYNIVRSNLPSEYMR